MYCDYNALSSKISQLESCYNAIINNLETVQHKLIDITSDTVWSSKTKSAVDSYKSSIDNNISMYTEILNKAISYLRGVCLNYELADQQTSVDFGLNVSTNNNA